MSNRNKEIFSFGRTASNVSQKTTVYTAVTVPPTMLYLLVVMPYAWNNQPVSSFFGLPKNDASSLLLDLCVAALPIVAVIAGYLALLSKKRRLIREAFIDEFAASELVRARYNPNILYKVLSRTPDGGIEKMQVVWSIKGRCQGGTIYEDVDQAGVSDFDADRFVNGT